MATQFKGGQTIQYDGLISSRRTYNLGSPFKYSEFTLNNCNIRVLETGNMNKGDENHDTVKL